MRKSLMTTAANLSQIVTHAAPNDQGAATGLSKTDKAMVKTVRAAFEEDRGHDLKITDSAILAIINKCEGWDDMDSEEQLKLFDQAEEAFKGIAVSDPSINGIVAKLDSDFYKDAEVSLEAFKTSKASALSLYGNFKRLFTKEQLNEMPYPGSDADDVKDTNYKPDIVEKKAVAGGVIRTVFTDDLVYAMPMGKAWQADIDDASAELKTSGSVARFKSKNKAQLRDILNNATTDRNNMRKMVRTAIQLHHKLEAVISMPRIKFSWLPGTGDKATSIPKTFKGTETIKVTRSGRPIWLETLDTDGSVIPGPANGKEFSVAQLIAFDPAWALKQGDGGTVTDLIDSAKPEPVTPESEGEAMSEETMDTTMVVIHAKLSNTEERAAFRKRIMQPDNETLRDSVCALYLLLRPIYTANQKWYDERINGPAETEKKTGTND